LESNQRRYRKRLHMEASLTALAENLRAREIMLSRLEALVNASPVAMFTCKAGGDFATTFVTEGVRALWGYEPEDFLTVPGFWGEHMHPEDAPAVFRELARLPELGVHGYDYRFRTKTGEYRWTHDELRLVRDAEGNPLEIAGYCFDITERKLAEAALQESEARQKIIFNSTSDLQALFRAQPDGGFVTESINRAMGENLQARMGENAQRFLGADFSELLAATGLPAEQIENRRQRYRQVALEKTSIRFDTPASDLRDPLEVTVFPVIDQAGNCTHVLWNGRNIARRMEAETARRESEERYKLVTEAIHEGIFDWNLVTGEYYLSPRYKEILGFKEEELASTPDSFFGRMHPDDSVHMAENVDRYTHDVTLNRFSDELRLRHRDGSYRWVVSRGRMVRKANGVPARIIGAIGDITERLESAANLAAGEQRLRDIIESLFGFVGVFTLDGRLIDCNHGTLDTSGIGPEDILGRHFWEGPGWRHDPAQQDVMRQLMARAAAGEVVRFETRPMIRSQQEIVVDMTFGPLRDRQGNICNIVAHGMDITPRKQVEAELLQAKEAAESASRAKSEFLANMSHEIRTPMNGIIGLTEVLLDTRLEAEQREYLTLVQQSAASLLTIINDILDVSKIEAGKLRLEIEDFDLRDAVLDTVKGLKVPAESKGLNLCSVVDPDAPAVVRGDPGRLRQILINLAGNAIKFTERGEVSVVVEPWRENPALLHFAVRDTGIGIPADKQALIFDAFTQADGSYTRKFGGTGLGLTIASHLVQMMGGRIWVESREGQGSTFHFTARLAPARAV
jgi:PAS domain S-box-containing protein